MKKMKKKLSEIICPFLVLTAIHVLVVAASTNLNDYARLLALRNGWRNFPLNWVGDDPCGSGWDGITCNNDNRIVSITLASANLEGYLSDIDGLSELRILDLSYNPDLKGALPEEIVKLANLTHLILIGCGFSGPIPKQIGHLQKLVTLSLNKNFLSGEIPPSIGLLQNLYWLDLADNQLSGSIPVSNEGNPGLDLLNNTKHFHLGNNKLSGRLPPELFINLNLIHLILENNELTGTIPLTLGLVTHLEVLRLDHNSFTGYVPENLNNLTSLQELYLSNNRLSGPMPNITGMVRLNYVDMSNNSFDATDIPPWFSSSEMQSLTTLVMENTNLQGELPEELFSLSRLQTVAMKNNNINGTLNLGLHPSTQLRRIDLQNNLVHDVTSTADNSVQIILVENPVCSKATEDYCRIPQQSNSMPPYSTPPENCTPLSCVSHMVSSPTCKCAYPYTGTLYFRAPSFSDLGNTTLFVSLRNKMMDTFQSNGLPVDSVSVRNPSKDAISYFLLDLEVFPSGQDAFNESGISRIGFMLSNQTFKPPKDFGPYFFIAYSYTHFPGSKNSPKPVSNIIIGGAVGGAVLFLLLLSVGIYAFIHKRRHETALQKSDPFASWDPNSKSGGVPQIQGARCFSLEELRRCTDNFSEMNVIGAGGYGKVYRGILPKGQQVAVKRAQEGSFQGGLEFKTEIELLSRVHHKNVISLLGFCFETREQMLVYEYAINGSLKDTLSGKSGIRLDWTRRLKISLGAAKGIHYLHDLVNPPVIHRDIKPQNVMLDERLNAKISDFGLSKLFMDSERDHLTTQVKGTMGYLDPDYYMTQRLTEKSDVYSFGVLLFELLTSRTPIENGKYIVREVKEMMDKSKSLYNLQELLDPIIASAVSVVSIEMFVDLALKCVREMGCDRPSMREVVKEIEKIMEEAGLNPNLDSASTSASHGSGSARSPHHPYSNESLTAFTGNYSASKLNQVE